VNSKWIKLLAVILVLAVAAGCSKKSTGPSKDEMPEFNGPNVQVPAALTANAGDPQVDYAIQLAEAFGQMGGFSDWMEPPTRPVGKTMGDDVWEETWTDEDGVSITLRVQETSTQITWQLILSGDLGDGLIVNNFTILSAMEKKDGSEGYLKIYDPESGEEFFVWAWTSDSTGLNVTFNFAGDFWEIKGRYNNDGSGWLEEYWEGALTFKIVWTAAGTGEWWTYNNGVQTDHGTFP